MKRSNFSLIRLVALGLILAVGVIGCKKRTIGPTPIPSQTGLPKGPSPEKMIDSTPSIPVPGPVTTTRANETGTPTTELSEFENMLMDPKFFEKETVYFDFDRFSVKPSETAKVEKVANYLKQNQNYKVKVDGHCDERGTEEYNRSLGERRALAVREHLVRLGVAADRIRTVSYGEDMPADPGHDEAAWAKNRRAEFVLLKPKQ